jgi:UDP-N-acetylmuramate dehydrogenase
VVTTSADPDVLRNVPLAPRTSLRVGGAAQWFAEGSSAADAAAAHAWSLSEGLPLTVLGGGTNVVVSDHGVAGLVLALASRGLAIDEDADTVLVTAAAGEPWDGVVAAAVARQGSGLECLSGIPGLAGGTPIQNVGAYGQEVAGTIEHVTVFDRQSGTVQRLSADACQFAYRASRFKGRDAGRFVVCEVSFRLPKGAPTTSYADVAAALAASGVSRPAVADVRAAVLEIRRRKGMVIDGADPDTRSVGSFFTNPVVAGADLERVASRAGAAPPSFPQPDGRMKLPAAWLIERAGFARGDQDGAVGLSTKHTLAIVTREGARAADVVRFAAVVARRVEDTFGVHLRPEPVFLGFSPGEDANVDYLLGRRD